MLRMLNIVFCLLFCVLAATSARAGLLYVLRDDQSVEGNRIYGFSVNETTGALTLLPGFPVATDRLGSNSFASEMLTVDRANNRLYVLNGGTIASVSPYSINTANGALTEMPFSPISLAGLVPSTIAVHPSGSPLVLGGYITGSNGSAMSFEITPTTATQAAGSVYNSGNAFPFSSVFSRDGNYFFTGGSSSNNFAVFSVNPANGVLTAVGGSPFDSGGSNPVGYATDAQGRFFTTNVGAGTLRVFQMTAGVPAAATGNPFASGLLEAVDGLLHPNGNFYFVADRVGNQVGSYQISGSDTGTTLTPAAGSPFPSNGTFTNALAINQAGTFLFAANGNSRNLTTYSVDSATGVLTFQNVQPADTMGTSGRITGIDYLATAPSAAQVSIGGRVLTAAGNGIFGATVTLTDAGGNTRTARTNPSGFYRFTDVQAGETYILEVAHKRYRFASQIVTITEELKDLNITAGK